MSITANYRRLPAAEFQRLLSDPKAAADFGLLDPDSLEYLAYLEDLDDETPDFMKDESGRYLDIQKEWHALHFLLTGKAEMDTTEVPPPLGNVVLGGAPTKWEAGYGVMRSLTPEEVKDVASALNDIPEEELRRRDLAAFTAADLYSYQGGWEPEDLDWLIEVFTQVRDFFSQAARDGDVVLLSS